MASWFNNLFTKLFSVNDEPIISNEIQHDVDKIIDDEYLLELEEKLLRLDCGIEFTEYICQKIKKLKNITTKEAEKIVKQIFIESLQKVNSKPLKFNEQGLSIIFISGVNGSGKTTSIGKLAYKFKQQNKKVLIAPCDTFRAAAVEQLTLWAKRAEVDILSLNNLSTHRPDSILFQALEECKNKNYDILLVDTAGRLQNKKDLMEELKKTAKIIEKYAPKNIICERWLVLDATTGQNAYAQAVVFNEFTKLTGIILSKFDGSAKGCIIFTIAHNLNLPIRFLGTGEKLDELREFNEEFFANNIF